MREKAEHFTDEAAKELEVAQRRVLALSRAADATIMKARREMQKERKDQFAELRPLASRPWNAGQLNVLVEQATQRRQKSQLDAQSQCPSSWPDGDVDSFTGGGSRPSSPGGPRRPETATASATSEEEGEAVPETNTRGSVGGRKVEWFHRNMVRREVWRQKFDFLYGQMNKESVEALAQSKKAKRAAAAETSATSVGGQGTSRSSSLGATGMTRTQQMASASAAVLGSAAMASATTAAAAAVVSDATSADGAAETNGIGDRADSQNATVVAETLQAACAADHIVVEDLGLFSVATDGADQNPSRSQMAWALTRPPSAGSVCSTVAPPTAAERRPSNTSAADLRPAPAVPGKASCAAATAKGHAPLRTAAWRRSRSSGGLCSNRVAGGPRQPRPSMPRHKSASLSQLNDVAKVKKHPWAVPTAIPPLVQELHGARDQYYGGDELHMHEDILYSTNPRLFPLRSGHAKAVEPQCLLQMASPLSSPRRLSGFANGASQAATRGIVSASRS